MSYLDKLIPGRKGGLMHTVASEVADTGLYSAASYGYGYVQNRYREKASLWGIPADLLVGSALSLGALAGDYFGVAEGLTPIARTVGRAGVGAFFHTLGAGHGAEHAGVKRLLISAADVPKAKAALPNATILGVDEKAPEGDFLSASELAGMARR